MTKNRKIFSSLVGRPQVLAALGTSVNFRGLRQGIQRAIGTVADELSRRASPARDMQAVAQPVPVKKY